MMGKTMKPLTKVLNASLSAALLLSFGCSPGASTDSDDCRGGKCDDLDKPDNEVEASPCDGIMIDMSGRNNGKVAGRLNDPISNLAFRNGSDCPVSYTDIMEKLNRTDVEGCDAEDKRAGISTRFVSESAQAAGQATNYRAVVTRTCNSRPKHGIIFSLFGVQAGADRMPGNVEIMAFDETEGMFNYYETNGSSEIKWFGNSKDMLTGPAGEQRRCAGCHTGGGLVMKELHTPWMHWEGHMDTPGVDDFIVAGANDTPRNENLGTIASGAEFEGLVKNANRVWNEKRLAHAREKLTTRDLLKPLFCTVEVNLDNGADFFSPVDGKKGTCSNDDAITCNVDADCGGENTCSQKSLMTRVNSDLLLDPIVKSFGSIDINHDDYQALLDANGSRLQGLNGAKDTVFDFVYPERAESDKDYVQKLIDAGVVDAEFVKDVLMVDFTRPIFTDDRCDLLEFVPLVGIAEQTPATLRSGMIANLGNPAVGSPAKELLNNLLNEAEDHDATVNTFFEACKALPQADFLGNAYTIASGLRNEARTLQVFEFPLTMPMDNLSAAPGQRLHPVTCQITTDYVPVAAEAVPGGGNGDGDGDGGGDGDGDGEEFCGGFDPNVVHVAGELPTPDACECVTTVCVDEFCCNDTWDDICRDAAANVPACTPPAP